MLALRLTDMSNRRMENINALDNPEEINQNFSRQIIQTGKATKSFFRKEQR